MNILSILTTLAADPSKNAKIEILKSNTDNLTLRAVILAALDPGTQYYIKKIPAYNAMMEHNSSAVDLMSALRGLVKLSDREITGNAGVFWLKRVLESVAWTDAEVIERIIARDLKCGVSEGIVNAAWPGFIDEFPYMRCALPKDTDLTKWDWVHGVCSELKADGMFVNINHYTDHVNLFSRKGTKFPSESFVNIIEDVKKNITKNTQTHGEILVEKAGKILPRELGNGILNSVAKGGEFEADEIPVIEVWDQIPLSCAVSKGKCNVKREDRKANLELQLKSARFLKFIESKVVHSMTEAMEHYSEVLSRGQEGTILKRNDGIWKDTTSKDQIKMKLEVEVDLKIVGFTEGNNKYASTFGAITCVSADGLLEVNVSGFKEKAQHGCVTRQDIWDARDKYINTIMTVRANAITPPTKSNTKYSLFLPRFVEFRNDKTEADTMDQIKAQFDNAVKK